MNDQSSGTLRGRWTDTGGRGPLLLLVVLAAFIPLQMLLGSLSLSFLIEPTPEAQYRDQVGQDQALVAVIALGLLAFGGLGVWEVSKRSAAGAAAVAVVAIAVGLGVSAYGHAQAEHALNPFAPELEAIEAYVPPSGARLSGTDQRPSSAPMVTRYWHVTGTVEEVCPVAEAAYREWVGPGEDVAKPFSCYLKSDRGGEYTEPRCRPPRTIRVSCWWP